MSLCPSTRVRSTSLREGRTSIAASADDEGGDAPVHEHSLVTMYDNAAVAADVPAGRVPDQVADHGFGHLSETVGRTTPPSRDLGMECQSGSVTQHDAEGVYGATDVTLSL